MDVSHGADPEAVFDFVTMVGASWSRVWSAPADFLL
jgi:hypothetical protein